MKKTIFLESMVVLTPYSGYNGDVHSMKEFELAEIIEKDGATWSLTGCPHCGVLSLCKEENPR